MKINLIYADLNSQIMFKIGYIVKTPNQVKKI